MLFETKIRTRTAPKRPGEGEFEFYDSTARAAFEVYRTLVNGWLERYPEEHRVELATRMRSGTSAQYQAALAELVMHESLINLGHAVEVHPACPHPSRRPDFLVKDKSGDPVAFIEVTSFGPENKEVGRGMREAAIYNSLERTDLPPGWLLGYSVEQHGTTSPSLAALRGQVEVWARAECGDDATHMPTRVFEADDWLIELTLHGGFDKNTNFERKIAAAMQGVRAIAPHLDIRQALQLKGGRYRIVDTPYLIVVADCKESIPLGDHVRTALLGALFGNVEVRFRQLPDGEFSHEEGRSRNGFWGTPDRPRNTNVSAVVILPEPNMWKLRDPRWEPLIAYNPYADNHLPDTVLPLPGFAKLTDDEYGEIEGVSLADLIELPCEWPPEE